MRWIAPTEYGDLDITINLSKPEKDPKGHCGGTATQKQSRLSKVPAVLCRTRAMQDE